MNKSAADFDYSSYNLGIRMEEHGSFKIFHVLKSIDSQSDKQETATKKVSQSITCEDAAPTLLSPQNEVCTEVTHFTNIKPIPVPTQVECQPQTERKVTPKRGITPVERSVLRSDRGQNRLRKAKSKEDKPIVS